MALEYIAGGRRFEFAKNAAGGWEGDFAGFTAAAQASLGNAAALAYLQKRGISVETAARAGCGFVERTPFGFAGIVFFTAAQAWNCRQFHADTLENPPPAKNGADRRFIAQGTQRLLGWENLGEPWNCFVCEGFFDYLSFLQAGVPACCLGTAKSGEKRLFAEAQNARSPLILAFDNDFAGGQTSGTGNDTEDAIRAKWSATPILRESFINGAGLDFKDVNEFFCADRAGFLARAEILAKSKEFAEPPAPVEKESSAAPVVKFAVDLIPDYLEQVKKNRAMLAIPTGLDDLDEMLGGGWQGGELYALGGVTGTGKTAFALQTAEAAALAGREVFYCSLEIPANTMIARLVSKWSWEKVGWGKGFSTRAVLRGEIFDATHAEILAEHQSTLEKIVFLEGKMRGTSVENLADFILHFAGERPPLIIVDYFQLLQADGAGDSDKQRADAVVYGLKQISNAASAPVLALSSLNRESYSTNISAAAFKESGAIEYTADVLLGLQLAGAAEAAGKAAGSRAKAFDDLKARYLQDIQEKGEGSLELKILKNRNGAIGDVQLFFAPAKNKFSLNSTEVVIPF